VAVDTKFWRLGVETKVRRFGVETRLRRFGEEMKGKIEEANSLGSIKLLTYRSRPTVVETSCVWRYEVLTKSRRFWEETKFKRFCVDTKFRRFCVETRLRRLGVETKVKRLGEETRPSNAALLMYPSVPKPATVDTNRSVVTSPEINPKDVDKDEIAAAIELFIDKVDT
jgi:hypothetical protein